MKKTWKCLAALVAALCLLCGAFGCRGNTNDTDPDAVELRVGYQQDTSEGIVTTALAKAFVEEQAALGKKVKVTPIGIPAGSYNDTVLRMYNGETLPDVVYTYDDYASLWAQNGVFEKLDPYFAQDEFDFSLYDSKAFEAARVYQNSIYYAPREYNHPVVFVNTAMMKEYGVDISAYRNGWTWEQLVALCEKIRTEMDKKPMKDYLYPLDASMEWAPVLNAFVRSKGGELFDPESGNPGFDQAGTLTAMTEINDMIGKKLIPDPRSTASGGAFLNENAAMWITSRPKVSSCVDSEIELAFLPMPKMGGEEGAHYLSYGNTGYAISSISEKKELAWEFLKFVMSERGQETFSATGNCVPILTSMQNAADATWRNSLPGVDQSAFVSSEGDGYTYILTTFARGYNPSKERDIYNKIRQLMGELRGKSTAESVSSFCSYAQEQVNGVK